MVKPIELNPEWVLSELPQSHYADGNGVVSVDTESTSDAKWIKLALNTLLIPYEEKEYGEGTLTFTLPPQFFLIKRRKVKEKPRLNGLGFQFDVNKYLF